MKVKFTKFERVAGLFVVGSIVAFGFFTVVVAIKQGWFSARRHFKATFNQGEGLRPGTLVQISGLRAGSVDTVGLNKDNKIEVEMTVSSDFDPQLKTDSVARVIRPFIIGDKVLEITVGSRSAGPLKDGTMIPSEETLDFMDLLGGGRIGPYLKTMDDLLKNLQVVAEAFADPKRSHALIGLFDEALPTMRDLREFTQQMTRHRYLGKSMANITKLTTEMSRMLPELIEFTKSLPELGENGAKTMEQMTKLTAEINELLPSLVAIAPQLPEASQKSVEALREAVIVLKAMQKSFLLRGAVEDVREEEAKRLEQERLPANEGK
ncbi:MAG: MCE family protein [Oligoflexia bacterium]|nr:MCE family protein [Oligoflexia bacterium]